MPELLERVQDQFLKQLNTLREATPLTHDNHAKKLMSQVDRLLRTSEGVHFLYEHISELVKSDIFKDTSWEDPSALMPYLVSGTLKAGNPTTDMELLSELRMLAIKNGTHTDERINAKEAEDFLQKVIVLNLDLIHGNLDEAERLSLNAEAIKKIDGVFDFLLNQTSIEGIKSEIAEELELISAQRPVFVGTLYDIIQMVEDHIELKPEEEVDRRIAVFRRTIAGPTEHSLNKTAAEYRSWLQKASDENLEQEAKEFAKSMSDSGLVSPQHVVLLRELIESERFETAKSALGLSDAGVLEFDEHSELVLQLIRNYFSPDYPQALYGLSLVLNEGTFASEALKSSLENLMSASLDSEISERLKLSRAGEEDEATPLQILIGGTLNVLGRPLGIGQGLNPTCQSARAISLWSEYAPAKLVNLISEAASENNLSIRFEGKLLKSKELLTGVATTIDYTLDPVSVVLVPHLDKIYNEMMKRASYRPDDPHKWVNPAFYGHWIPTGFASAFDYTTQTIHQYDKFVRYFFAAFHPEWNGDRNIIYPIPLGLYITSPKARMLGFHAVSMLRIDRDDENTVRIYFLNPNNEGRQNWGQGIKPTVFGHGERPGESSLPFEQFASRVYAYHYISTDVEERASKVPVEKINEVRKIAEESWGPKYNWTD